MFEFLKKRNVSINIRFITPVVKNGRIGGNKRKLNCKSIVEKYKILKRRRTRDIVWCDCKKIRHRKTLFNWIKDKSKIFSSVEANNLINLSVFAENNQIGGLVMRIFSNSRDRVGCYIKVALSQ